MKTIFITGATGNMGWGTFQEFIKRNSTSAKNAQQSDNNAQQSNNNAQQSAKNSHLSSNDNTPKESLYFLKLLVRNSKKNHKLLTPYLNNPSVEIIWGDLLNYEDILEGVKGADYVLHIGGMVSPQADFYPEKTLKVNVESAKNIIRAIHEQPNKDEIGAIYIGSVAQSGPYYPPHQWGRVQNRLTPAKLDSYAESKCIAEAIFAESGLKKWVSIRQTGMLYPSLLKKANDPITFHVPFKGVLEWSTVEDSARAMVNACGDDIPSTFWRHFYNLSSGPSYRLTNYQFETLLLKSISCPKVEKIFKTKWFATRNFHGYWFADSDKLEEILHFRANIPVTEYFHNMSKELPWYFSLAPIAPPCLIRAFMRKIANSAPLGTMYWIKTGNQERIKAHFGSLEEWKKIPDWDHFDTTPPSKEPSLTPLDFNPEEEITLQTLQQVASKRGGKCLATQFTTGDIFSPVKWERGNGTQFTATPNSVLNAGHWDHIQPNDKQQ